MCLILFAHECHPKYHLILAANRDEFYERPAVPLAFWDDAPSVLAGRDLKNMGTWLGINTSGSLAAITNFRDPESANPEAPSRGGLVSRFLIENHSPESYIREIEKAGHRYNGFNLLVAKGRDLFYYANKGAGIKKIDPGLYGLSNDLLDTPWPKVVKGKDGLQHLLSKGGEVDPEAVFDLLSDGSYAPDAALPDTGVGDVWERILSPLFINSKIYGTRCSSVILIEKTGKTVFYERTFRKHNGRVAEGETVRYSLP